MGSGSFRTAAGFDDWPYALPVVVLSASMTDQDVPDMLHDKVRISRASPGNLMQVLAAEGWVRAYVDGGAVVGSFLRAGLISNLTVTVVPILLGQGIRMFGVLERDIPLTLDAVRRHPSGLTNMVYRLDAA